MSSGDAAYFAKHGVEGKLSDVITALAKAKPDDPFGFIADEMAKLSAAAKKPAAAPAPAPGAKKPVAKKKGGGQGKAKPSGTTGKGGGIEVRKETLSKETIVSVDRFPFHPHCVNHTSALQTPRYSACCSSCWR
jgi:hypothetical protein